VNACGGALAGAVVPAAQMRTAACLVLLAIVPAVCLLAGQMRVEPYLAILLLAGSITISRSAARRRFGTAATLVFAFFVCATCHAGVGYLLAQPTSRLIWIGTAAERYYACSFLVISAGLLAAAMGYAVALPRPMQAVRRWAEGFRADEATLFWVGRALVLIGAATMFTIYARVGLIPFLNGAPGQARYLTSQLGNEYRLTEWLISRALDLLTFGLPLVVISATWRKERLNWLLASVGLVAILLPLRRANVLSVLFVLLIIGGLRSGKVKLMRGLVAVVLVIAYGASQLVFINLMGLAKLDLETGTAIVGSALPEVRDLGWTIELLEGDRLQGTTFAQALVPVPSLLSDFSRKESLRAVTSRLIGLDMERRTGGLRVTLAGEAYLNFDYFGPVFVGFLFGIACAVIEAVVGALRRHGETWAHYVAALLMVWTFFWLYLGGTQAAATIKMGALLLVGALFLSRQRRPAPADGGYQ
jgi:hypothetical protein